GGLLFISIYNDQGGSSRRWRRVKHSYNRVGRIGKGVILTGVGTFLLARAAAVKLLRFQNPLRGPTRERGMEGWSDLVDWVGGYPFEVAKPEEVFEFVTRRGFTLQWLKTCAGGYGCNEFVFRRV